MASKISVEDIVNKFKSLPPDARQRLREKWDADRASNAALIKAANEAGKVKMAADISAANDFLAEVISKCTSSDV